MTERPRNARDADQGAAPDSAETSELQESPLPDSNRRPLPYHGTHGVPFGAPSSHEDEGAGGDEDPQGPAERNPYARETPAERRAATYSLGKQLGLDQAAVNTLIDRRGTVSLARRELERRVNLIGNRLLRERERQRVEEESAKRRDIHESRKVEHAAERRSSRSGLPLGARLDAAYRELGVLASAPAGSAGAEPGSRAKPESSPPPAVEAPPVQWRMTLIEFHVEQMEHQLDVFRGLEPPTTLSGDEKDHLILTRFVGVHARDLSRSIPELGSQRTIERVRANAGQRPSIGGPR